MQVCLTSPVGRSLRKNLDFQTFPKFLQIFSNSPGILAQRSVLKDQRRAASEEERMSEGGSAARKRQKRFIEAAPKSLQNAKLDYGGVASNEIQPL
jgi:hypothetical protein